MKTLGIDFVAQIRIQRCENCFPGKEKPIYRQPNVCTNQAAFSFKTVVNARNGGSVIITYRSIDADF